MILNRSDKNTVKEYMLLPLDVMLIVLEYTDSKTNYKLGLSCKLLSQYSFQKLWNMIFVTNITTLNLLVRTLSLEKTYYQYKDWIAGLALHMKDDSYETIPDYLFKPLSSLNIDMLSIQKINIVPDTSSTVTTYFKSFIHSQLNRGMAEFHIHQCTLNLVYAFIEAAGIQKRPYLETLCMYECYLDDNQIEHLAKFCPKLTTLKLDRCGCFSDHGLISVAKNCHELRTLLVTLPSYFIQSNTITVKTIDALSIYCPRLQHFVCEGQIRISEYARDNKSQHFTIITNFPPLEL